MKRKALCLALAMPIFGLVAGACSREPGDTATSTDAVLATADELMVKGQRVFNANCAACHQPNGLGIPGAFPPLAGSDLIKSDRRAAMAAVLFGLSGPITVNGVEYNGVMPGMGYLSNQDLAAVLTYVFGSWGNDGPAVSVEEVAALRAERK